MQDDFEVAGKRSNISSGAPKHWRLRRKLLDKAAFSGLKVSTPSGLERGLPASSPVSGRPRLEIM